MANDFSDGSAIKSDRMNSGECAGQFGVIGDMNCRFGKVCFAMAKTTATPRAVERK